MNYQPHRVEDVSNWFLFKEPMSPKKLQKILYYAYSWTLALFNDSPDQLEVKLFEEGIEAWVHGPVIPKVYFQYREHGFEDIPQYNELVTVFSEDIEDILEQVWEVYGDYNGNELESITHQEDPWISARDGYSAIERCNEIISDEVIYNYYIHQTGS